MAQRIEREHQDKKLHVVFNDGEIVDLNISLVNECNEPEDCRGFVYDLITTNRPERVKQGSAHWAHQKDIESFAVIGEKQDGTV